MAMLNVVAEGNPLGELQPLALWTCNAPAWDLFMAVQTQWRVGMGGREGLDYGAVEIVMQRRKLPEDRRDELFAKLQTIEFAALSAWAEQREMA